jgi:replicative DNA helicase
LRAASGLIASTARSSYGEGFPGTAIVSSAHLNDNQTRERQTPARPKPGMQSIKGSSSLKQDADYVCFVWQKDDEMGVPTGEGRIWLAKSRQGESAGVDVQLNSHKMRFEVIENR